MHLRYDMMTSSMDCKEDRHPQLVMRELGITYQMSTPQSMAEQIWFWNCNGVPTKLPKYLTVLNLDPHECIGFGLSHEDADKIAAEAISAVIAKATGEQA